MSLNLNVDAGVLQARVNHGGRRLSHGERRGAKGASADADMLIDSPSKGRGHDPRRALRQRCTSVVFFS